MGNSINDQAKSPYTAIDPPKSGESEIVIPTNILEIGVYATFLRIPSEFAAQVLHPRCRASFLQHFQEFLDQHAVDYYPLLETAEQRLLLEFDEQNNQLVFSVGRNYDYSRIGPIMMEDYHTSDSTHRNRFQDLVNTSLVDHDDRALDLITEYLLTVNCPLQQLRSSEIPCLFTTQCIQSVKYCIAFLLGNFPSNCSFRERLVLWAGNTLMGKRRRDFLLEYFHEHIGRLYGGLPAQLRAYELFETLRVKATQLAQFYARIQKENQ